MEEAIITEQPKLLGANAMTRRVHVTIGCHPMTSKKEAIITEQPKLLGANAIRRVHETIGCHHMTFYGRSHYYRATKTTRS